MFGLFYRIMFEVVDQGVELSTYYVLEIWSSAKENLRYLHVLVYGHKYILLRIIFSVQYKFFQVCHILLILSLGVTKYKGKKNFLLVLHTIVQCAIPVFYNLLSKHFLPDKVLCYVCCLDRIEYYSIRSVSQKTVWLVQGSFRNKHMVAFTHQSIDYIFTKWSS